MRCWWCGAEAETYEIRDMQTAQPVRIVASWPDGDHVHTERPPSPAELEAAGHAALMRIMVEAS